MNQYDLALRDGSEARLSFSRNLDNLIRKYRDNKQVEGVFLMDCGIVTAMPHIMRYCFEEDVNLRERDFLRELHSDDPLFDNYRRRIEQDFSFPLREEVGTIRSVDGNLIIYSSPSSFRGKISFDSRDVPEFVEGIIKILSYRGVCGAQIKCAQIIQHYHQCLDDGLLEK